MFSISVFDNEGLTRTVFFLSKTFLNSSGFILKVFPNESIKFDFDWSFK